MATQHLGGPGGSDDLRDRSLGALTACFILALNAVMPAWLAALIVAVGYGTIGAFLALRGRDKVKQATPLVPGQTVETVKEDVEWPRPRCDPRRHSADPGRDERDRRGRRLQGRCALAGQGQGERDDGQRQEQGE